MNGSWVMAKIAGTLSTANTRSAHSMRIRARNSGVIHSTGLPLASGWRTKKRCSCRRSVMRRWLRRKRTSRLFSRSGVSSTRANSMRTPVSSRNTPNT